MATPSGPSRLGPWELANRKPIRLNPDGDRAYQDDPSSSQQSTHTRRRRRVTKSTSSSSSSAPSYTRHAACLVASLLVQSMTVTAAPATPSASNEYTRDSRLLGGQTRQESIHMAQRSDPWSRLSEEQKRRAATARIKDQILAANEESYPRSSRSIQSSPLPITHTTRSIPLVRKRATHTDSAKAYSSGIIADWTHQSRSVWFERKAIIITSCFLAIFIVLIIGVTVLVSGRKGDLDDIDEEEFSDDAAIRRMLRERKMRGGGQKETRKQKRQRKKEMKEKEGASLGTSTAISKRIVSKWVRSPGRSVSTSSPRGTVDQADSSGVRTSGDVTSLQSTRSDGSPRTRLGEPRQESVSVEYHDGDGNPLPPASRQTSPEASASGSRSTATSHDSPPTGSRTLDETDIQAAEGAEQSEIAMPPAYISANGGTNAPPASSSVPPVMQRPLAGEVPAVDGDSKQPQTAHATSSAAVIPLGPPTPFEEQSGPSQPSVNTADDPTTGHIAVDDKARLAAMAAAASAPSMAPSAPQYSRDGSDGEAEAASATVDGQASWEAPSAPTIDLDADGFERPVDGEGPPQEGSSTQAEPSAPMYAGASTERPREKGKARDSPATTSSTAATPALPQPPRAHVQAFSPFDSPYSMAYPPAMGTLVRSFSADSVGRQSVQEQSANMSASEDVNLTSSARRQEKQREAEAEMALTASSPSDFAHMGTEEGSAPVDHLPVYTRAGDANGVVAHGDSVEPSAPQLDSLFHEDEDDGDVSIESTPSTPSIIITAPDDDDEFEAERSTSTSSRRLP